MKVVRRAALIFVAVVSVFSTHFLGAQDFDPAEEVIGNGELIMDTGFRANFNGFGFPNYGSESGYTDLVEQDVFWLFGEEVCATQPDEEGWCNLTPNAQLWAEEVNEYMGGGHCDGMAVLSLIYFTGYLNPADYGSEYVPDLWIEGNDILQREIAFWWATQTLDPTMSSELYGTPTGILEQLVTAGAEELYTIGIWAPDWTAGHRVTPYAVADMGGGIYRILVYDNNYPYEERFIEVDANSDSWVYTGATIPTEEASLYYGDGSTQTMTLVPMSARVEQQICPFCERAIEAVKDINLSLDGSGYWEFTDANGNKTSYVNGQIVNNIPGARVVRPTNLGLRSYMAPRIYLPAGTQFTAQIWADPNHPDTLATSLSITQGGKVTTLSGFTLSDTPKNLGMAGAEISYQSDTEETLIYKQGLSAGNGHEYLYVLEGTSDTLTFAIDPATGEISIEAGDGATFILSGESYDEDGNYRELDAMEITVSGDDFEFSSEEWEAEAEIEEPDDLGDDDLSDDEGDDEFADDAESADDEFTDEGDDAGDDFSDDGSDDEDSGDFDGGDGGEEG